MACTGTSYIPDLGVSIFSVTRALTKGFNVTSEKEILVLKKNATTLKLEERLDYGNSEGYLLAARLHASPHDTIKLTHKRRIRKKKILTKEERMAVPTK